MNPKPRSVNPNAVEPPLAIEPFHATFEKDTFPSAAVAEASQGSTGEVQGKVTVHALAAAPVAFFTVAAKLRPLPHSSVFVRAN